MQVSQSGSLLDATSVTSVQCLVIDCVSCKFSAACEVVVLGLQTLCWLVIHLFHNSFSIVPIL